MFGSVLAGLALASSIPWFVVEPQRDRQIGGREPVAACVRVYDMSGRDHMVCAYRATPHHPVSTIERVSYDP